jgi:hypothetical protein
MNTDYACKGICAAVLASLFLAGCNSRSTSEPSAVASERHHEGDGHDHSTGEHSHTGPHDGHLIELGSDEAFHAELIHDDKTHRVTIFILDGKAKNNVPIPQPELAVNIVKGGSPKQFKLAAVSQANELRDMASCFQLESEELCSALDATDCKGRLAVNINGKQYIGEIEHHDHEDHDREHRGDRDQK